jgi:transcription initiation factor TFIIA large subunit
LLTILLSFAASGVFCPRVQDDEAAASAPPETDDLLVCQFEKVAHVKDRWKIILKDGILRVNKKDFVFSRAIGEFDW